MRLLKALQNLIRKAPEKLYAGKTLNEWEHDFNREHEISFQEVVKALKEAESISQSQEITLNDICQLILKNDSEPSLLLALIAISHVDHISDEMEEFIISLIQHKKDFVRRTAALILTRLGTIKSLIAVVSGNRAGHSIGHTMQKEAMWEIRAIGPAAFEAIPALMEKLKPDDFRTQFIAADALISIGAAAKQQLIQNLDNEDRNLRYFSAYALQNFTPPVSLPKIDQILEERQKT